MELWTRYPVQSRRTVHALLRGGRSEVLFRDRDDRLLSHPMCVVFARLMSARRHRLCWHVKSPFDFEDIVIVKPVDLDDGSRRIGTIAPKFLLYLIGQWTIPVHVRRVDHDSQAILQRGSLTFSDMLHIEEGLPDACLGAVNQFVCRRIDAAHTRDIKRARRLIE